MKSKQWDKLTEDKCVEFCNNWCCPCNDGSTGCFANEYYQLLCENAFFKENTFSKLLQESYDHMVNGESEYEEFCERFTKELGKRLKDE